MDHLNHALAWILVTSWAVPVIVAGLLLGCVAIIWWNYLRHHRGLSRAMAVRLRALEPVENAETTDEAQQRLAADFLSLDETLRARDGCPALTHAWLEYGETIIDPNADRIASTARPEEYFLHLGDNTRVLAWWANLFVAFGLTFTFLGIIAALTATTDSLRGADTGHMSVALITLLTLTAAKFWTSIAGVVGSIVLRWFDRRWHSRALRNLERMSYAIERGTCFVPAQRIAVDQLKELKQQSVALTEFTHQLAASIGDAFNQHIQPVVTGLAGIQGSIDDFKNGSFATIGEGLNKAISDTAGSAMDSLAVALTGMTAGLQGVNDRLEGASGAATEQIATAAREFSSASEQMTRAFAALNGNLGAMSDKLVSQAEDTDRRARDRVAEDRASYDAIADGQRAAMRAVGEELRAASSNASSEMVRAVQDAVRSTMGESQTAIRGALEGFAGATSGIQSAFDAMRAQVAELGQALSGSASAAAERNAEVLGRAAATLETVTAQAASGLGNAVGEAVTRSAEASGAAISAAFAAFGERFEAASGGLVQTLTTTAGRMEMLVGAIERSTGAAGDHASKLADAGREAQAVGTMLGRAANDVAGAASPIRDAATSIRDSVGQSRELLRQTEESGGRQRTAMETIAGSLERTGNSAAQAWEGYSARFAEVDEALARALEQIRNASAEHAGALNTQVGRIDTALAQAVERLAGALDTISDLASALEDVRGRFGMAAE